jgi:hypothetical protein
MCFHPAYPSTAVLSREAAAKMRDVDDLTTLRELHGIVSTALDRASCCDTIRNPDRHWQTCELIDALAGALADIDGEAERIRRSPGVIEDAE